MVAFALIFCLYLTNRIVHSIGGSLPPTISFSPSSIINRSANQGALACLSSRYANTTDLQSLSDEDQFRSLAYAFDIVAAKVQAKIDTDSYWKQQADTAYQEFNVTKCFTVLIMIILLAELLTKGTPSYRRAFFAIGLAFVMAAYFTVRFLHAVHSNYSYSTIEITKDIYNSDACSTYTHSRLTKSQIGAVEAYN